MFVRFITSKLLRVTYYRAKTRIQTMLEQRK